MPNEFDPTDEIQCEDYYLDDLDTHEEDCPSDEVDIETVAKWGATYPTGSDW